MKALISLIQPAFDWTWQNSLQVALLVGLVVLVQTVLARWLTPRLRYALSLLILLRLLLPAVPSSPLSLENLFRPAARLEAHSLEPERGRLGEAPLPEAALPDGPVTPSLAEPAPVAPTPSLPVVTPFVVTPSTRLPALSVAEVLGLAWACGLLALVSLASWRYAQWCRLIGRGQRLSDPRLLALLDEAREAMGVRRPVTLVAMARLGSPAVFGFRRVRLLLPETMLDQLTDQDLRLLFLHEMAHVRRQDMLLNLLLMAVQFVHWFNPLLWLGLHRLRADRELVCDAMVLQRTRPEERSGYGLLLLKLLTEFPAEQQIIPTAVPVVSSQRELKRRIVLIKHQRSASRGVYVATGLAGVTLACLTFTGSSQQPPAAPESGTTTAVVNEINNRPGYYKGRSLSEWLVNLDDQHPGPLNDEAAEAVRHIGTNGLPTIISMLQLNNPMHHSAVLACQRLGSEAKPAIPALMRLLNDGYANGYVGVAMARIGQDAIGPLTEALTNDNMEVRCEVARGLGGILFYSGKSDIQMSGAISTLINCLSDKSPPVRFTAAHSLGRLKDEAAIVVPALVKRLDDTDTLTRRGACIALGQFGAQAKSAIPALMAALSSDARGTAATALVQIEPDNTARVNSLMPLLIENIDGIGGTNTSYRSATATALCSCGEIAKQAVPALLKAAQVTMGYEQQHILVALKKIDSEAASNAGLSAPAATTAAEVVSPEIPPPNVRDGGTNGRQPREGASSIQNPYAGTNLLYTGEGRAPIIYRLNSIRLDRVSFDRLPLGEAVRFLINESKQRDPEERGVSFLILAGPDGAEDLSSVPITINPPLTNIRLADVLDAVCKGAGRPIKYSIEDYAVVFSARTDQESPLLYVRAFKVDPNTIVLGLAQAQIPAEANGPNSVTRGLRDYFARAGVHLDPTNIFYSVHNGRQGELVIRATMQDLDIIEAVIMVLNYSPPQLSESGRDYLLGWYKLPNRHYRTRAVLPGPGTLIPVLKRGGVYCSVSNGAEIPLKQCPEGLEWGLTESSMRGTKIGLDAASKEPYIIIEDRNAQYEGDMSTSGEKQFMTKIAEPPGLLTATAKPPQTVKDFTGCYQLLYFPAYQFIITRDGDKYQIKEQRLSKDKWIAEEAASTTLEPLPDKPGFAWGKEQKVRLVFNRDLKRYECLMGGDTNNITMPLVRVSPSLPPGTGASTAPIGVPAWH